MTIGDNFAVSSYQGYQSSDFSYIASVTPMPPQSVAGAPMQLFLFVLVALSLFPLQTFINWSTLSERNLSISWIAAYIVNCVFVSLPGRFDNSQVTPEGGPWTSLFAPAPWAFAIWGAIYLSELILSVSIPFYPSSFKGVIRKASPWWVTANAFQCLWCLSFRPKFVKHLWFPTLLLGGGAVSLIGALRFLSDELITAMSGKVDIYRVLSLVLIRIPLSMHAGWLSAATLLNLNGWAAYSNLPMSSQVALVFGSVFTAFTAGVLISLRLKDPVYAFTIAWATLALMYQTKKCKIDVSPVVIDSIALTEEVLYKALILVGMTAPFVKTSF
jgi:hypothetical protein